MEKKEKKRLPSSSSSSLSSLELYGNKVTIIRWLRWGVVARLDVVEEIIDNEPPPSKRLPTKFNKYCSRSISEENGNVYLININLLPCPVNGQSRKTARCNKT